jgi:hypothetical protein
VRQQLIDQKGYAGEDVPCEDTIRRKLNALGYRLRPVKKSQPLKKIAETDAIFDQFVLVIGMVELHIGPS